MWQFGFPKHLKHFFWHPCVPIITKKNLWIWNIFKKRNYFFQSIHFIGTYRLLTHKRLCGVWIFFLDTKAYSKTIDRNNASINESLKRDFRQLRIHSILYAVISFCSNKFHNIRINRECKRTYESFNILNRVRYFWYGAFSYFWCTHAELYERLNESAML